MVLRVKIEMSSKRASVNPLAGFLKPRSPAERLAAQHRDREKLHVWTKRLTTFLPFLFPHLRVSLCVAIAACKPLTSLSLLLSTVQHQHQPQLRPLQQISVAVHRQHSQGFSISKVNSRLGPPNVPSNSKFSPQTPLRIETEN